MFADKKEALRDAVILLVAYQVFKFFTDDKSEDTQIGQGSGVEQASWKEFVHDMLAKGEV